MSTSIETALTDFLARCDAYCERAGVSRAWLSKRLFGMADKLDDFADRKADTGAWGLTGRIAVLEKLEAELEAAAPARCEPQAGAQA
jgi:hypothetical protein